MIKYYLKLAFRNLQRNKLTKGVKIAGMAVAIAVSMIIFLFVNYELNYDRFFPNYKNVYRISRDYKRTDGTFNTSFSVPIALMDEIKQNIPEIKHSCRTTRLEETIISRGETTLISENALSSDSSFFKIYNIGVEAEDFNNILTRPNSVAISKSISKKLFGEENPLGKAIERSNGTLFTVSGVFEDFPANSTLNADFIFNQPATSKNSARTPWNIYKDFRVLTEPGASIEQINRKINQIAADKVKYDRDILEWDFSLQPITEIHTQEINDYTRMRESVPGISKRVLKLLTAVAFFILLVAWLNHINISTNLRLKQVKQNSIDKVFGMGKKQQFSKILTETIGDFFSAFVLAVFLMILFLPQINRILDKELILFSKPMIWGLFIAGLFVLSLLTATFENTILSKIVFVNALKGQLGKIHSGNWIKQTVMILHYAIVIVIIFFSIVVYNQTRHLINLDLGWTQDKLFAVKTQLLDYSIPDAGSKKRFLLNEINKLPEVESVSMTNLIPRKSAYYAAHPFALKGQSTAEFHSIGLIQTDNHFLQTFGISILSGENIKPQYNDSISNNILIAENVAKKYGFQNINEALGNVLVSARNGKEFRITGIYNDILLNSLYSDERNPGSAIINSDSGNRYLVVKFNSSNPTDLVNKTSKLWANVIGNQSFDYFFLNDSYRQIFKNDLMQRKVFLLFALTAVIIACMGLFAMAFETIVQRTKEIGIRKVNGAKISNILKLLFSDYLRIIGIAVVPGLVIAFLVSTKWLEDYANRIPVSWYFFIVPLVVIAMVTIISVLYHSYKAAVSNPIDALKYE